MNWMPYAQYIFEQIQVPSEKSPYPLGNLVIRIYSNLSTSFHEERHLETVPNLVKRKPI